MPRKSLIFNGRKLFLGQSCFFCCRNRAFGYCLFSCPTQRQHQPTPTMTTIIITNAFTGYKATIRTASDLPAISTVEKHFRKAKASDCMSQTTVEVDGVRMEIVDMGRGKEWVRTPGYQSEAEQSAMQQAEEAFCGF